MDRDKIIATVQGMVGYDIIVTTDGNEIIFMWDEVEQMWYMNTVIGKMMFDTEQIADELETEEVYCIERVY